VNLDPSLLEILACPACRSPLRVERLADHPHDADPEELVCANAECRRAYPVHDDIPVLLVDDARVLSPDAHAALLG
jgi:uncharacterized protein YbaR (Trm112 family)